MVSVRSGSACLMVLFLTACGGDGDGNGGGELPLLPPASNLVYASPPAFTVTIAISPIVPTHSVHLTNFSIIPSLPAGLVLDPATGVISGTPTQVSETTRYTVSVPDGTVALTATLFITVNPLPPNISYPGAVGVADTFDLDIEVTSPPANDLGNTADFETLGCGPTGLCTVEGALAGPTLVIRQPTGWNTYSSVDGALIAHIDIAPGFATAWTLATDGSYLMFAGTEGVQAITPQGMTLFTHAGDYLAAAQESSYFAGPDEIRVANGPAGAQVIENIAVPSGATTTSPAYAGNFAGWFLDGEKFLSTAGNTVRVYSRYAVQLDLASLPAVDGLAGSGESYWTSTNTTQPYRVGSAGELKP